MKFDQVLVQHTEIIIAIIKLVSYKDWKQVPWSFFMIFIKWKNNAIC